MGQNLSGTENKHEDYSEGDVCVCAARHEPVE